MGNRLLGGLYLSPHSPRTDGTASAARHGVDLGINLGHLLDKLCIGIFMGVLCVKPIHIRTDNQRIGIGRRGDHGRKIIVIANFELVGGDGIVLVDDRQ